MSYVESNTGIQYLTSPENTSISSGGMKLQTLSQVFYLTTKLKYLYSTATFYIYTTEGNVVLISQPFEFVTLAILETTHMNRACTSNYPTEDRTVENK